MCTEATESPTLRRHHRAAAYPPGRPTADGHLSGPPADVAEHEPRHLAAAQT
ncbi:hypothetical protein [Kibdelosporangium philippinense]|uniref:hypothetical protein n=1 Tax=Kibdelosporangium philippinense TaxID=211113 RepID=UPI00361B3B3D